MAALSESEMGNITILQREEGLFRLSRHFSWTEFSGDETQVLAHQQFVYETTMFAAGRGLCWSEVTSVARMSKDIFPELKDLDPSRIVSLIRGRLLEYFPRLNAFHHATLFHFLSETCVTRQRLIQAVVGGAGNLSVVQKQLEVQVPPLPLPLNQGTDVDYWEHKRAHSHLAAIEKLKEEELEHLRKGSEVILEELDIPQEGKLDKDAVMELVRSAVRARGELLLGRLLRESSLVYDLLELKLQHTTLATRGIPHTCHAAGSAGLAGSGTGPAHTAKAKKK
ncbi:uncharacterized protein C8orf74 homolog [Osmerus eperlanus]|uniref:uncharacterized protein C8orf74 homolog n=1 Tax=Osmerus eperlanus TaxID=29151 RepID=UPI002E120205